MKRKTKLILSLLDRLCLEIDLSVDDFILRRPFLYDPKQPVEIIDRTDAQIEQKVDADVAIEEIVKKLQSLLQTPD